MEKEREQEEEQEEDNKYNLPPNATHPFTYSSGLSIVDEKKGMNSLVIRELAPQ